MTQGTRRGIACVGNWILDMVNDLPHWPDKSDLVHITAQTTGLGGGPANVAGALAAMDVPYPLIPVGLVGAGMVGDEVLRLCLAAGLPVDRIGRTAAATTAQTLVMNVPGDSRTFFYHPGANDLLDAPAIDVPGLAQAGARIFYLGYLTLLGALDRIGPDGRTAAAHVLADARDRGMLTCVDLVSARGPQYRETVMATLPEIDILLLNEIEAARATGLAIDGPGDASGMEAAARALCDGGVHRAVILHSAERVIWLENDAAHVFTPPPVPPEEIVSPVGAGDAFAAGVLHGLHEDWPRARAIHLGFRAARACLASPTATGGLSALRGVLGDATQP